jgi:ubiquinone/menaquinone biosynthesis C-methylase UbiE
LPVETSATTFATVAMERRAALIDGYNRVAPTYDQTAGLVYAGAFWKFLPRVQIGPFPAVLDLGCGTGINLLEAAGALGPCRRLHGIDLAAGMINEARRKAATAGIPATFEVGDAENLALEDGSFDLVICNSVYHWFSDRSRAVAEMNRVLRPGGQVLINGVADPNFHEWIRVVDEVWSRLFHEQRSWLPALPTPTELMGHLRAAGFAVEHLEYQVESLPLHDVGSFLRTITVVAPTWLAGVPEGGVPALMNAMTAALSSDPAGPFVVTSAGMASVSRKPC